MCSAAGILGFVNLVNREEIPNLITNESVDVVPLGNYFCKLLVGQAGSSPWKGPRWRPMATTPRLHWT